MSPGGGCSGCFNVTRARPRVFLCGTAVEAVAAEAAAAAVVEAVAAALMIK